MSSVELYFRGELVLVAANSTSVFRERSFGRRHFADVPALDAEVMHVGEDVSAGRIVAAK